jgi:FkbM family methyltransferase
MTAASIRQIPRRIARRVPGLRTLVRKLGRHRVVPEGVELDYLLRVVGADAKVILEIGANDGVDSLRLAAAFTGATVHCFEPDPRALALLRANAEGADRLRVHPLAICDTDGPVVFHQSSGAPEGREDEFPDGWHLSGSVRPPLHHLDVHQWCTFDTTIEVEGQRLDTWSAREGVGVIDLIWADVQGAEGDLVRGGTRTLASTRYFYTEFDDNELYAGQLTLSALLELLPGWTIDSKYSNNVLLRNTALD